MKHKIDIAIIFGAFVAGAVVSGLLMTGGPATARAERRDDARLSDLRQIASFLSCVSKQGELPETLSKNAKCGLGIPFDDPVSEAPYDYKRMSENSYQLCAAFEMPERLGKPTRQLGSFDAETSCFTVVQSN